MIKKIAAVRTIFINKNKTLPDDYKFGTGLYDHVIPDGAEPRTTGPMPLYNCLKPPDWKNPCWLCKRVLRVSSG